MYLIHSQNMKGGQACDAASEKCVPESCYGNTAGAQRYDACFFMCLCGVLYRHPLWNQADTSAVMAKNTFHVNEKQEAAEDAERAAEKAKQRPRYQEVSRPKTASRITGRSGGSSAPEDGKKEDAD